MAEQTAGMNRVTRWLAGLGAVCLSDRELLARFAGDGDQIAFEALVNRHSRMVIGVCRRLLPCVQDAEDACQAVFLLLAKKAGQAQWQASLAGWLYTTARKVAHNSRVAAERRMRRESRAAVSATIAPADGLSGRELVQMLDQELERIGPRYREPLVLCYLEGLTQDEAAARLGVPRQTLKSQLKRARRKLASALAARGCDLGVVLLVVAASSAEASTRALRDSILASATGVPSAAVAALARGIAMNTVVTYVKAALVASALVVTVLGIALAANQPVPSQPVEKPPERTGDGVEQPMLARIGTNRFRADYPIEDARFSPEGKWVVACAGGKLFVWNAAVGQLVRRIDTGLGFLDNPTDHEGRRSFGFALHPRKTVVACGGSKDGHTVLQTWDYATGKKIAEATSSCDALKALAWTPEGDSLLERADNKWVEPGDFKLIVWDEKLKERNAFDLPKGLHTYSTAMQPLPGGKQILLWHGDSEPMIFDIEFGKERGVIAHKQSFASGLALSPDARLLAATSTDDIRLLQFPSGEVHKVLPVLRSGWYKPRPLFSPDGKTVFIWDHRPIAYDVETGKEKWKASSRTIHTVRMDMCDVSPDGASLLIRHGQGVSLFDAGTGAERNLTQAPSLPSRIVWSPDGTKIFTRVERHERTWTAWNAATGARLYDLQPTGYVQDDDWKMLPDMFFISGGREIVVGLEKRESTEGVGPKELLVFEVATGNPLRRLGKPLPKDIFQWMYPIAVDPAGKTVLMQMYAISAPSGAPGTPVQLEPNADYSYKNILWDPVQQVSRQEFLVYGDRTDNPGNYAPYYVTTREILPSSFPGNNQKGVPAKIRCYSLAVGKLAHELESESLQVEAVRISDDFLLALGNDGQWVHNGPYNRFVRQHPYYCDLWDISAEEKVRVYDLPQPAEVALGPQGKYVIAVLEDGSFEIFEPFVLKKAVAEIATPSRAKRFEFSLDGKRLAVSMRDTNTAIWDTTGWQRAIEEQIAREVPSDLTPLWADLGKDAPTGQRAARLLGAAGDKAVPFLAGNVSAGKQSKEVERRAIRALRWLNTAAARAQLEKWAKGDPNATLTKSAAEAVRTLS